MNTKENHLSSIDFLHELSLLVKSEKPQDEILSVALKLLCKKFSLVRAAITLINPKNGSIRIEASFGLDTEQASKGAYHKGEGITGKVIQEGKPFYSADVSQEPLFLNRTGSRNLEQEHISFLCAPILLGGEVVGALSVDSSPEKGDVSSDLPLYEIVCAILAHTAHEKQEQLDEQNPFLEGEYIGKSGHMARIMEQIRVVAPTAATVLITGESGVGKELVAQSIYRNGGYGKAPFIALNCAALPENLIESELFGHEKGAFTGAAQTRKGRFEQASNGVLFLDEIGELSLVMQAKLLRVLQEKTFERLGGMQPIHVNVRLIAATNRDLPQMVEEGGFRRDLYYRLNVFPIHLPPLRERKEDILLLANYFLDRLAKAADKKTPRFAQSAVLALENYEWPGNVRELQNILERTWLMLGGATLIRAENLQGIPLHKREEAAIGRVPASLEDELALREKKLIENALVQTNGKIRRSAALLGVTERILGLRLKKYGLNYKDFRKR